MSVPLFKRINEQLFRIGVFLNNSDINDCHLCTLIIWIVFFCKNFVHFFLINFHKFGFVIVHHVWIQFVFEITQIKNLNTTKFPGQNLDVVVFEFILLIAHVSILRERCLHKLIEGLTCHCLRNIYISKAEWGIFNWEPDAACNTCVDHPRSHLTAKYVLNFSN